MHWVTRQYLHLDRVATPWLIRRFIDPDACFSYVPWKEEHLVPAHAIPLALPGAELGPHDKNGPTFRKVLKKYDLHDKALDDIAAVIEAGVAYVLEGYRPQSSDHFGQVAVGLLAFAEGVMLTHQTDDGILEASFPVYDALYANFRIHALLAERGIPVPDDKDGRGPSNRFETLRNLYNKEAGDGR